MFEHSAFTTEPWAIRECRLDLDLLAKTESLFALSNGHVGLRGNLDEGEPYGVPGTYLNSVFEIRPLPYGEAGYGYPEAGQSIVNVTNGKLIRLLVDDEPFDVRYGHLDAHERTLDLRAGTLTRTVKWTSPAGQAVRIVTTRIVSLSQRAIAAIHYEVEPIDAPARIVAQSELVANESLPHTEDDPRVAAVLASPLLEEERLAYDAAAAVMLHRLRQSGLRVAAAMDHEIVRPDTADVSVAVLPGVSRATIATRLEPGEKLVFVKYLAYGWSSMRSRPALHDQVVGALTAARLTGWDGLLAEQRSCLDEFWNGADVEVEGDARVQQAVRFALFHVLQAALRAEQRPIPAKGLTGPGYDGHTFWDTETYVLPALIYTHPGAVADALRWRQLTLPLAKARAQQLGLQGAAFPWRTIRGEECSAYWPAGTAAFHINADIADAALRYLDATEDEEFEREAGLELLVESARLWRSLGHHDADGRFRIDGVTGPDEYSAIADNNVFTNLMAQRNLAGAADLATRHRDRADELGVTIEEAASWRDAARTILIPYDDRLGVHPQSEEFTEHDRWDFENTPADSYPLLLHVPYFDLYRKQVVKQADLVLAMYLCGDAFSDDQKRRNFAYYEALTVRDSSLSASTQAVIAAEVGQVELAYDYLAETALVDFSDLHRDTSNGLHLASLAGTWTALVAGFGGMRTRDGRIRFAPRLPGGITGLRFRLRYRGRTLLVSITATEASYELLEGVPITIEHFGLEVDLDDGASLPIPPVADAPRPTQPFGRAPRVHRARS